MVKTALIAHTRHTHAHIRQIHRSSSSSHRLIRTLSALLLSDDNHLKLVFWCCPVTKKGFRTSEMHLHRSSCFLFAKQNTRTVLRNKHYLNHSNKKFLSTASAKSTSSSSSLSSSSSSSSFSSSIHSTPPPATDDNDHTSNAILDVLKKEEISRSDSIRRVSSLAKPEASLIAKSVATLGITSSITLLIPSACGQIIDICINNPAGFSPYYAAGGLLTLTAIAGGGVVLRSRWLAIAGNRIVARMRREKCYYSYFFNVTCLLSHTYILIITVSFY